MNQCNDLERRILNALRSNERIMPLLRERGLRLQDIAAKYGYWTEQVSQCIRGARPYPEIRDNLAKELGLTREEIDELIDGRPGKAESADEGADQAAA